MNQDELVVQVHNLSKIYKLYDKPEDRLKEAFHPFRRKYHHDFHALRDINFSVAKGEVVGIVGINGSGKSTLLQIITGVLTPTTGSVSVTGKVSALLELGAGFNPELSGLENVYFKSSLLDSSRVETSRKIDDILSFADIGDFIHQPVKTYSSGMYVRLAFSVAINVDPDILIIDEALSVGDFRFKQKCLRKINQFREEGKTILFVSHDQGSVINFCTRAIWLLDGVVHQSGDPGDVCKDYISYMAYGDRRTEQSAGAVVDGLSCHAGGITGRCPTEWFDVGNCESFGAGAAIIEKVSLVSQKSYERIDMFEGGERVVFSIMLRVKKTMRHPIVGFHVSDVKGIHLFGMNNYALGIDLGEFREGDLKIIEFEFGFPYLKVGNYSFSPAVAEGSQADHIQHHWVHDAYIVRIASNELAAGLGNYLVIRDNFGIRVGNNDGSN
jgi:ABC-type polysaccharide/polyol phosphate transport system ATPase subunit